MNIPNPNPDTRCTKAAQAENRNIDIYSSDT